jgi:site-specific DNA-cytosine methylase
MPRSDSGLCVLDLFCGAGGFSEGFRQAGFDVVRGIDNWRPACETHEANGFGRSLARNLLEVDYKAILHIKEELEGEAGHIDVVIGSPPCTEFSYAKKGGKGDIEKGMLLVRKHLQFVALLQPRFWLMENVPRLQTVLDRECEYSGDGGWEISYDRLEIPSACVRNLGLVGNSLPIPHSGIYDASDYGACQSRKRFIAGNYPIDLMDDQKVDPDTDISFGGLLSRLRNGLKKAGKNGLVVDPNYPRHKVRKGDVRDHSYSTIVHPMHWEEMRHLKTRHIQYGHMDFPDDLSQPARTVMATSNRSSREAILVDTRHTVVYQGRKRPVYRQPTVREIACVQGFPLDYQLCAQSIPERYKLVGNAVPCQLSYGIARAIRQQVNGDLSKEDDREFILRSRATLSRGKRSGGPIIRRPPKVVHEAAGLLNGNQTFSAKPDKYLRRKLMSSKLERDSSVVIFENSDESNGGERGGIEWKACIQKGIGARFHRVYLDRVSMSTLIRASNNRIDSQEIKNLVACLMHEVDQGLPELPDEWIEFGGHSNVLRMPNRIILNGRLKIPDVGFFQKAFTSDLPDIGKLAGPLDFFDCLDAIMISAFSSPENRHLMDGTVHVKSMRDSSRHSGRSSEGLIPRIDDARIPLVTIAASFLSVCVLRKMYEGYPLNQHLAYSSSVQGAFDDLANWIRT